LFSKHIDATQASRMRLILLRMTIH